jgi:uncharacterized protein (UPF0248 family)
LLLSRARFRFSSTYQISKPNSIFTTCRKKQPRSIEVQKESISDFSFPKTEVLSSASGRMERSWNLHRATSLGNLEKQKVRITFEDSHGLKVVHTTIWAVTQGEILLKAGRSIPLHRIHEVKIL